MVAYLFSCASVPESGDNIDINNYFAGNQPRIWQQGLKLIERSEDQENLYILAELYLDDKYSSIHERIAEMIISMVNRSNVNFSKIILLCDTTAKVEKWCKLSSGFRENRKLELAIEAFSIESDNKDFVENLGRYVLSVDNVLNLYSDESKSIKSATISASAYIKDEDIYNWLVDKLFEEDEELSSSAVFSLSSHGNTGFSYLAKNLTFMSTRLKLITIDLLTFNNYKPAYDYFAILLEDPNSLVTARIIKSYREMGIKSVDYIIDALLICHAGVKLQLLELLSEFEDADYLTRVLFLLEYPELQDYIIELCFEEEAIDLLKDMLLLSDYGVEGKVIDYIVTSGSDILLNDRDLNFFILKYFLDYYDPAVISQYFKKLGYDINYIDDYKNAVVINESLKIVDAFIALNGERDFVTRYFELKQKESIADEETRQFYLNMENWLETGDDQFLEKSKELKKAGAEDAVITRDEKEAFLKELTPGDGAIISKYEEALENVIIYYRKITFRLNDFARILISREGYYYLIR